MPDTVTEPVGERVARQAWRQLRPRHGRDARPAEPTLVLLAGVPMSGKTTLTQALVDRLPVATLHVENDRLRRQVARARGDAEPTFAGEENLATYVAARRLIERGLEAGLHVLHDATNLTEGTRSEAYEVADRLDAPVRIVFLRTPKPVREDRAQAEGPAARQAHGALGDRDPSVEACSRPTLVLDGTAEPEHLVDRLLADDRFGHVARPAGPADRPGDR